MPSYLVKVSQALETFLNAQSYSVPISFQHTLLPTRIMDQMVAGVCYGVVVPRYSRAVNLTRRAQDMRIDQSMVMQIGVLRRIAHDLSLADDCTLVLEEIAVDLVYTADRRVPGMPVTVALVEPPSLEALFDELLLRDHGIYYGVVTAEYQVTW